jgi:hypothetical protein
MPDTDDSPKYWMHETSGVLRPAVEAYLNGEPLSPSDVRILRAYLFQWVQSPVWAPSGILEALRLRVAAIADEGELRACVNAAVELGLDPL